MIVRDQHPLLQCRARDLAMREVVLCCVRLAVLLFMTLPTAPVHAAENNPLVLTGPAGVEHLSRHFEYTIDPDWQLTIADFAEPSPVGMRDLPGTVPDFGYTPARIWLKLPVVNATADRRAWRLFLHTNFMQKIAVHQIAPSGTVATLLDLTEDTPFSGRPIANPQLVAPFELAPGETATLIVSYYSQGASRLSMSIETPESFADQSALTQAKSFAFYGMMLVMIALAAVALVVLRQPVFAAYAGYLFWMFIYVAHADGMAFQYIWPDFPRFNSMASIVAGSGVMVFGGLFAISFLQTRRLHPVMHRVLLATIASVLTIDVILWATDPQLLKRLLVLMIAVCTLAYLTSGLVAARTRFREVRFYVFAWAASFIPALLFTARFGFGFEPAFITTYDAVRLALLFDALMMGLAVFDSYNQSRRSAMEETLAQVQHNLALSQRLVSLEQSYEQVTTNARQREESVKDTVHDLRQPMHALRLSLRQMLNPDADKAADVGHVESALAYMERLVAERLAENPDPREADPSASARATAANGVAKGGDAQAAEPGLHGVLRGIADMFAPEAAAKGLGLRLVLAAPDAEVAAYPLMRVVANLVSNSIKYTRQGRVVIGLRRHGAGHRVEIHDTGPGLSGPAFEQALLRNQRLDRDRMEAEGAGIGLSVVRDIAETQNWPITSCAGRRSGATIRVGIAGANPGGPGRKILSPAGHET